MTAQTTDQVLNERTVSRYRGEVKLKSTKVVQAVHK